MLRQMHHAPTRNDALQEDAGHVCGFGFFALVSGFCLAKPLGKVPEHDADQETSYQASGQVKLIIDHVIDQKRYRTCGANEGFAHAKGDSRQA